LRDHDGDHPTELDALYGIGPIDHIGIAVHSIEEARPIYEAILGGAENGAKAGAKVIALPAEGVNIAFFGSIELLEPGGPDSSVARFLEARGPGLHHVALRVKELNTELARLSACGFTPVAPGPRTGALGHRIAFIHPASTGGVLIELVEVDPATGVEDDHTVSEGDA
jgi:methylmalonyl-CoA epimerase